MKKLLHTFMQDESGQALSEYALILAVIAVAVIVTAGLFKDSIVAAFERVTNELNTAATAT